MTLLEVRDLCIDYFTSTRVIHAVRGVSFDVAPGERVALVGESGSGKTTTALALMQMIEPPGKIVGGTAKLNGTDLLALRGDAVRASRLANVAYIPQGAMNSLNPVLRLREQILDGLVDHGQRLDRKAADALVAGALKGVGLSPDLARAYPHELSGGMKQRACIAIAIAMKPDLVIADEPTSALDVITQKQVMATLIAAQEEIGCGLLLIGHDMGLMAQATNRVIVLQHGLIAEDAPVGRIFTDPQHAYSRMLIDSVPTLGKRAETAAPAVIAKPEAASLMEFDKVSKTFGGGLFGNDAVRALDTCSFRLADEHPQIISVVGQSGSGKTTLARMVLGFETPSTGEIRYRGKPMAAMRAEERRAYRREVQAIFQDPYGSFNPFYKVDRALSLPLANFGLTTQGGSARSRMEEACEAVGLDAGEVLGRFPHELSGGQRQRLMVARALMIGPRMLVADEPVSMVDASLRMTILGNLQRLKDRFSISVIYITHDLATAYHVSDYVLVLHKGRIVEAGLPGDVIERPEHPYTRSLVDAIPWPDPNRHWGTGAPDRAGWDARQIIRGQSAGFVLNAAG
ncbi:ABC transporter ATP-binding protein [Oceaniglobus trochenteri]|uniref:ABC transporter ATP-binding protein n=1 Tax=Oceaniglobus trochenteri TaxID=2763260 RepID=UPI001CFFC4EF|nr:ABC transporter ATP-binding protein [Oceaniglobus trochenteri]